jgi:hypothetical protein
MGRVTAAVERRARTRADDEAALDELHSAIAAAIESGRPVSDLLAATGYNRETVRRIARSRGVNVDGRSLRRQGG